MTYKITPKKGHFEVYIDGQFYCSADKWSEAVKEIQNYMQESRDLYEIKSS